MTEMRARLLDIDYINKTAIFSLQQPDLVSLGKYLSKGEKAVKTSNIVSKTASESDYPLELAVKKPRKKRSLDANAYLWELLDQEAQVLSRESITTRQDLYRNYVRGFGVFRDVRITSTAKDTLAFSWGLQGIGYFADKLDDDGEFAQVRLYYGSSCYNSKQFSRLIDAVREDCEQLGIEVKTPDEIAEMVSLIETAR